ncbi:MAG: hypothetical protein ACU0BB_07915 [Paracoccaceae bacterium]
MATDAALEDINAAPQLAKDMQRIQSELDGLRRSTDHPQNVTARVVMPEAIKGEVALPKGLEVFSLAIAAEMVRRMDQSPPAEFLKSVLHGTRHRLVRRAAEKAVTGPDTTTGVGWANELNQLIMADYFKELAPRSVLAQLINFGYARSLTCHAGCDRCCIE